MRRKQKIRCRPKPRIVSYEEFRCGSWSHNEATPSAAARHASSGYLDSPQCQTHAGESRSGMSTTRSTLFVASAVVILALGFSFYEHRQVMIQRDAAARVSGEAAQLEDALKQSKHEAASFNHRAVLAEKEAADLQRKLNEFASRTSPPPANVAPKSAEETRRLAAEKMAQMKPLLEAGMPIKGAVVLYVHGKPVDQPVSFVIGKETRIAGDDGTYSVTPSLNQNGSVRYACNLLQADPNGGAEQVASRMVVVAAPWGDFTFGRFDNGTAMGFVPDMAGP